VAVAPDQLSDPVSNVLKNATSAIVFATGCGFTTQRLDSILLDTIDIRTGRKCGRQRGLPVA
jgi:hypothetical protein